MLGYRLDGQKGQNMKTLIKNSRVCGYLEKIFRELNLDKFDGELEEPIITVQSTPRAYGHVTCSKVWKSKYDEENGKYELNMGAGTIARPIEETVSTMLHEMVHIYNLMHGIQDCSRNNTYHNKKFRDKAEEVGLVIEHDPRIGWSITSPSDDLILYIADKGWEDILINREEGYRIPIGGAKGKETGADGEEGKTTKKPSSTRKYICPCCGNSVRATKSVKIMCMDCEEQMVVKE